MVEERYELSMERIAQIYEETACAAEFQDYFRRTAGYILMVRELVEKIESEELEQYSYGELAAYNRKLYADLMPESYETSYANPAYAVKQLGREFGQLLCVVYAELRAMIADAYEHRLHYITVGAELFIELYNLFEEELPDEKEVKDAVYWYMSDYCDVFYADRIREGVDSSFSFAEEIIMKSDLSDVRYLFQYGEYITDCERRTAEFLNTLPEEEIEKIAAAYVEGFRKGFELAGKPLDKKQTVNIRYAIGFERIIRAAVKGFAKLHLKPVISRYALHSVNRRRSMKIGYSATPVNRQYEYDHRFDEALYYDKAFYERKISVLKAVYEKYETEANGFAGPAVLEVFGEEPFSPQTKPEACALSEKQQKLLIAFAGESSEIQSKYIKPEERSFTIIAFPTPEIGADYEKIFAETVKINTLDYEVYKTVQQNIIDALDQAEYVTILGAGDNCTDLTVQLVELSDPQKETKFENCVADVNIPVGEVFTSPELKGTNGILYVSEVFLNELPYKKLRVEFKDGCISSYTCGNFAEEEANKSYFRENVMQNQETLPLGEFAIGTNTTAYVMARKYNIAGKLPILIAEKTGPHFAVGDTCYSRAEDVKVYNPDGKEIIARENDFSRLRHTDMAKAYFNCHTDITIPYDEIAEIACHSADGTKTVIIKDGRFVLPGTELLNKAFG
ncbi:MAG: aminopeptidase [Lachnospiraceae bacterium]|nr:aminopeptidase [Lachnospiraceae bacterium]